MDTHFDNKSPSSPPTDAEVLRLERGAINDYLAARDRAGNRLAQLVFNSLVTWKNAITIEPKTSEEEDKLSGAVKITAAEKEKLLEEIEDRGRIKGIGTSLGIITGSWLIDKNYFPDDHIKWPTLLADFASACFLFNNKRPWVNRATTMLMWHTIGRTLDHFMQGNELTNAHYRDPLFLPMCDTSSHCNLVKNMRLYDSLYDIKTPHWTNHDFPLYQSRYHNNYYNDN